MFPIQSEGFIPSVNFHLWEPCNMRCKFCFATFQDVKQSILPKGHLPENQAMDVVWELAAMGFRKITFAGGEPTLCPWLPKLMELAKSLGMTTMIVTNGIRLTKEFLRSNRTHLDWIALSVDSLDQETNLKSGRAGSGRIAWEGSDYLQMVEIIKSFGYGFKINTVVHSLNKQENFSGFIEKARPQRWKVIQVLPIAGQNDFGIQDLIIDSADFNRFLSNHSEVTRYTQLVPENNDQMTGSYAMVDPAGRFFDNVDGRYRYSNPILQVGGLHAYEEVRQDYGKFIERGGLYNFQPA